MGEERSHDEQVVGQFTLQAHSYAQLTEQQSRLRPATFAFPVQPDDEVLDVACGAGAMALKLAPRVRRVTGIDLTEAMLVEAQAAAARQGATNVSWRAGDVGELPFAPQTFSLVVSQAAFHHFDRPRQVLAEMARVCRTGGQVVVVDVAPDPGKAAAYDALERARDPSHVHAHPLPELQALAAGLDLRLLDAVRQMTPPLPYDAVLATSHPEHCTIEQIRAQVSADARAGTDRFGLAAREVDGRLLVAYPMGTTVWIRT